MFSYRLANWVPALCVITSFYSQSKKIYVMLYEGHIEVRVCSLSHIFLQIRSRKSVKLKV